MRLRWRLSCAALILSVVACDGKSVAERIAEHDRVRVSWEQTSRTWAPSGRMAPFPMRTRYAR